MSETKYDLVIIGAGPGGYVAAIRAAQLGLKVACVEAEPALGGTCLRVGCIPSKVLLESSEHFQRASEGLAEHGVKLSGVELDLGAMMKRKQKVVGILTKGVEGLFKKNGITRIKGFGRLDGTGRVVVEGDDATVLEAVHIIVATGSKPASLRGVEVDGSVIGGSTEALGYDDVPERLVVIGAGYIGLELGSVWARLGSDVTVLEYFDRIVPNMDSELAAGAQKLLEQQGLTFRLGSKVTGARVEGDVAVVECEGAEPIEADRVLQAVGRVPNTAGLGLDSVGITLDERGRIPVSNGFATAAEGVYAIGDVIQGPMLAHKAEEEGMACAERLAGHYADVDYNGIPGVCYTHPEIASVGRSEDALKQDGVGYRRGVFPFRGNGRARSIGEVDGFVKILADAETDRVLGVHILGPRAGDLIAEAAVAIAFGATSEDITLCSHAHPTLAEAVKEAALAVDGRALHI